MFLNTTPLSEITSPVPAGVSLRRFANRYDRFHVHVHSRALNAKRRHRSGHTRTLAVEQGQRNYHYACFTLLVTLPP